MQTFTVTLSRAPVSVFLIIAVPLLSAVVFMTPLILMPSLPQWVVIAVTLSMMAFAILSLRYVIKKWGSVQAIVRMDNQGITITMLKRTVFYPRMEYASPWAGIKNLSSNFDPQHHRSFYLISFRAPSVTVSLMPDEAAGAGVETLFGEALHEFMTRHNAASTTTTGHLIGQLGFFDASWAKALTILTWIMIATLLVGRLLDPDRFGNRQLIQAICFGGLWLSTYYINRRRKA